MSWKILNNGNDNTMQYEKLFSDIVKDQKEICEKFKENMKYLMEIIKWKIRKEMKPWKSLRHESSKHSKWDQVT